MLCTELKTAQGQNHEGISTENLKIDYLKEDFQLHEVIESILEFMTHAELKLYRQVNKLWNCEACRFLRRKSIIYLNEYQRARLDEFAHLLNKNFENEELITCKEENEQMLPSPWPLPFRFYSLEAEYFEDEFLLKIISDERLAPVKLIFHRPPHFGNTTFASRLYELLSKNGRFLQHVHFTLCEDAIFGIRLKNQLEDKSQIILPELNTIEISESWSCKRSDNEDKQEEVADNDGQDDFISFVSAQDFLINLISSAPRLQKFVSYSANENTLVQILSNTNLKTITHFSASYLTPNVFKKLETQHIPKLRSFYGLIDPDLIEEEFVGSRVIHNVVKQFSRTLEKLYISWNFNSINDNFPCCPKLTDLAIKYWSGSLGAFNSQRLPQLKKLHVFDCINELTSDSVLNPHEGVNTFVFECMKGTGVRFGLYSEEDFTLVFKNVVEQFPNLTCLDLNLALTVKSIRTIINNFPKLVKLVLDSDNEYVESVFTGLGEKSLKNFLNSTSRDDMNKISKLSSFIDLKCLKHLILSRFYEYRFPYDVAVTPNVIRYGLSKMPNLEILQFDWEDNITAKVVQKELAHLSQIVINCTQDMNTKEELELAVLTNSMSQVELNVTNPHFIEQISNRIRRSSTRRPSLRHRQRLNRLTN